MRERKVKRGGMAVKRDIKLVPAGNSQGIRFPKAIQQKYGWSGSLVQEDMEEESFFTAGNTPCPGKTPTAQWRPRGRDWSDFDAAVLDGLK